MNFDSLKKALDKIKDLPLPGLLSQNKMSPPNRNKLLEMQKNSFDRAKKAAVLALFYPNLNHECHLVLIHRKTYEGVHSDQVGFPGGKTEKEDKTLKDTALRETEEEIGVPKTKIKIVKELTSIYIPPSNFLVKPFIGLINNKPNFIKQEDEIEAIIEVSLSDFLNKKNMISKKMIIGLGQEMSVPAYLLNEFVVWGATAMVLSEIKDLLKEVL